MLFVAPRGNDTQRGSPRISFNVRPSSSAPALSSIAASAWRQVLERDEPEPARSSRLAVGDYGRVDDRPEPRPRREQTLGGGVTVQAAHEQPRPANDAALGALRGVAALVLVLSGAVGFLLGSRVGGAIPRPRHLRPRRHR